LFNYHDEREELLNNLAVLKPLLIRHVATTSYDQLQKMLPCVAETVWRDGQRDLYDAVLASARRGVVTSHLTSSTSAEGVNEYGWHTLDALRRRTCSIIDLTKHWYDAAVERMLKEHRASFLQVLPVDCEQPVIALSFGSWYMRN
jgi:hypothetical protein